MNSSVKRRGGESRYPAVYRSRTKRRGTIKEDHCAGYAGSDRGCKRDGLTETGRIERRRQRDRRSRLADGLRGGPRPGTVIRITTIGGGDRIIAHRQG